MHINIQPIEKRVHQDHLEVHSIFRTIQGEGPFTGQSAVFIRLAGCNLRCPSCDTDYTSKRFLANAQTLLAMVEDLNLFSRLVVITGGEPFRQDITELVVALVRFGYRVQIETNGTLAPDPALYPLVTMDIRDRSGCFIVCSPKAGKVHPALEPVIGAYKYVLTSGKTEASDGLPITVLDHSVAPRVARPPLTFRGPVYVQPADMQDEELNQRNLSCCIKAVMEYGYTLQLQIHKIINME